MEFSTGPYYTAMDREYHEPPKSEPRLERPIMPIDEIGVTVPEKDPMTGGHILTNIDANIRMGASRMQIVMTQSHHNPIGAGVKGYGKEVRENIRELIRANNVKIEGLEMPTSSMSNLSGFDPQRQSINEEKRQADLREVKDAIKFIGDIAGGGGVDVWSQEFTRKIVDAPWNRKGKWAGKFEAYEGEEKLATEFLVDRRTGHIQSEIKHSSDIFEPVYRFAKKSDWGTDRKGNRHFINEGDWVDMDGNWINPFDREDLLHRQPVWDPNNKKFEAHRVPWEDIVKRTDHRNALADELGYKEKLTPAEYAFRLQMDNKWIQLRGSSLFYTQRYEDEIKQINALKGAIGHYREIEEKMDPNELYKIMEQDPVVHGVLGKFVPSEFKKPSDLIKETIAQLEHSLKHIHEASSASDAQAEEIVRTMSEVESLQTFAKSKAIDSYAEAGLFAVDETKHNPHVKNPIHVGPEIGWPTGYGGHPEEFIELIKESRKKLSELLVKQRGYAPDEATRTANEHIRGCFDTGHAGMWLQHFKREGNETEEGRLARFKNWYMDMVKKMQEEDVIGGIQAVDSATGAHSHLPPGQGILPVVEAVDYLKSHGFTGFVVSEGHEEEQFGRGRILLQTWRAFGADISDSYFGGRGQALWSDVADSYFGHANPPPYVLGAYKPTEDWVFWSGVPIE